MRNVSHETEARLDQTDREGEEDDHHHDACLAPLGEQDERARSCRHAASGHGGAA